MTKIHFISRFVLFLVFATSSSALLADSTPGAFAQHQKQFSLVAGNAYAFGDEYLVVGLGIHYFVLDGLSTGLHMETWTGGDPRLNKITPSVQYVMWQFPGVKPYAGMFYRKVYIEAQDDLESAGGRAGAYFQAGNNAYMGAGVVYETYADCDERIFEDCSETYPEFLFSVSF
ncbi:hypothetical protein TDB9533_03484 [Thalassocella blandensis]|nr:hypothetical protein TDB9533_03484 [Thalassocella blandensis]